jgi:hypothetical protein
LNVPDRLKHPPKKFYEMMPSPLSFSITECGQTQRDRIDNFVTVKYTKMKKHFTLSLFTAALAMSATAQNANTFLSNLTSPTAVNEHLLPQNNNTKNLGSSGKSWKNLYVAGRSYLGTAYTYFDSTNQFRINNGGDRLVIDAAGNIGIGTLSRPGS